MKLHNKCVYLLFAVMLLASLPTLLGLDKSDISDKTELESKVPNEDSVAKKHSAVRPATQSRFVKNIDDKQVEKSWEDGDEDSELEDEFKKRAELAKKIDSRKGKKMETPQDIAKAYREDPIQFTAGKSAGGASVMFFVKIKPTRPGGKKKWTKHDLDVLAEGWQGKMRSASTPANVFNIGQDLKDPQLLVNVDKGWDISACMKFVLSQPETISITRDQKDYTAADFKLRVDDDDDDL